MNTTRPEIPKLEQLLKNKTVLVLGAGASKDYGFPLWGELKSELINTFLDKANPLLSDSEQAQWWVETLEKMEPNDTIDRIAATVDGKKFDLWRTAVAFVIAKYEKRDNESTINGWIEVFLGKFLDVLFQKYPNTQELNQIANNLSIVTLNYDRLFEKRFLLPCLEHFKKRLIQPREFEKRYTETLASIGRVQHPHGFIGSFKEIGHSGHTYFNKNKGLVCEYGDVNRILNGLQKDQIPFVFPVDDLQDADNPSYKRANTHLLTAKHCICVGLSPEGIEGSLLNFSNLEKVYYSGRIKVHENFIPLDMRASELFNEI